MRKSLHQCELRGIMDLFQIFVLTLYITQVITRSRSKSKRKYATSSDEESIENLLYFKDCQRRAKEETTPQASQPLHYEAPTQPTPKQPECPFPKMCCALTCGNECSGPQQNNINRMMEASPFAAPSIQPLQAMPQQRHSPMMAVRPLAQRRKKKMKLQPNNVGPPPPGASRRAFSGLTKERIKGLIAQDDDIRKILKDLVRVTMQKVDLVEMVNSKNAGNSMASAVFTSPNELITSAPPLYSFDDYDE